MSAGNWIFSILGTVVLLALVVGTIVWLLSNRSGGPEAAVGSAGEILDRRLAGGEITSEQDDELRERLDAEPRDQRPPSPAGTPG